MTLFLRWIYRAAKQNCLIWYLQLWKRLCRTCYGHLFKSTGESTKWPDSPVFGVAYRRVCACSVRSRLVLSLLSMMSKHRIWHGAICPDLAQPTSGRQVITIKVSGDTGLKFGRTYSLDNLFPSDSDSEHGIWHIAHLPHPVTTSHPCATGNAVLAMKCPCRITQTNSLGHLFHRGKTIINRPGRSQGLLYKPLCHSLIH